MTQEHLAIEIYQIDGRGRIGVQVRASTELWGNERQQSQLSARLEVITSYERLRRFSDDLQQLVKGHTEEVLLEGEYV